MDDAENPDYEDWNPETDPQPPVPATNPHNQGILSKPDSYCAKKDKEPTEKRVRDWLQFGVNTVLAVVGVIAICIYHGQLTTMNNTFNEIQKQTPDIHNQAVAAENEVLEAERQTRLDARPWIRFRFGGEETQGFHPTVMFNKDQPVSIPSEFMNVGKTPALDIHGMTVVEIVDVGKDPRLPKGKQDIFSPEYPPLKPGHPVWSSAGTLFLSGVIYPDQPAGFNVIRFKLVGKKSIPETMEQSEIDSIRAQKSYVAIWGKVWYKDVFGTEHWTQFCDSTGLGIQSVSKPCAEYNNVDNNDGTKPN